MKKVFWDKRDNVVEKESKVRGRIWKNEKMKRRRRRKKIKRKEWRIEEGDGVRGRGGFRDNKGKEKGKFNEGKGDKNEGERGR